MKEVKSQSPSATRRSGKSKVKSQILFMFLVSSLFIIFNGAAAAELTAIANHDHIKIDFMYHGSSLSIRGVSDPGTDLVVKIASPEGHQALKRKGKVAGLLWMNVGELKFDHVPNFYAVHSTKKLEDILSAEEMDKYVIGYPALERHVDISPVSGQEEKDRWFTEFLRFKESSKLFAASSGSISITNNDGKQNYYILTEWPYQAPPGDYLVSVYAVKDKKITEKAEAKVQVEQAGIVKTLSGMAKESASAYGLLSIIAALGAGFGVGLIFRKGGGAH